MKRHTFRRREMILATGLVLTGFCQKHGKQAQAAQDGDLTFRTTEPRNAEPPIEKLVQSWITPNSQFYVRSHAANPVIDPEKYRLSIDGLVDQPSQLSLNDLRKLPERTVTATLTCAGNRRIEFNKQAPVGGVQWESGAIGNATWTGVSLSDVLKQVGVQTTAKHLWFEGLDEIPHNEEVIPFGASIPIEKAAESDGLGALLVHSMNGEPLTADHGFPLRTLVPGYIGARSVKWLGRIVVSDTTSPNHYLATAYKLVNKAESIDWSEAAPIYRNVVNAAVGAIEDNSLTDAKLAPGPIELRGYVIPSGSVAARVARVLVSVDSGKSWSEAELLGDDVAYCWRLWKAKVELTRHSTEIIVRAADSSGGFMPARVPWNAKGYLQNAWYRVPISVS